MAFSCESALVLFIWLYSPSLNASSLLKAEAIHLPELSEASG